MNNNIGNKQGKQDTTIDCAEIYSKYAEYIRKLIYKLQTSYNSFLEEDDAEDVFQRIFEKLLSGVRFEGRCSIKSFLFYIVRSCFIDFLRERKVSTTAFDEYENYIADPVNDIFSNPEKLISDMLMEEVLKTISEEVGKLSDLRRMVFKMIFEDGLMQVEIANTLGISQTSVSEHKAYVLNYLKQILTEKFPEFRLTH